jgi:hypothetical protein
VIQKIGNLAQKRGTQSRCAFLLFPILIKRIPFMKVPDARHHGLQDECQNKNINDLASPPSSLPENSWVYQKAKVRIAMRNGLLEGRSDFCA